MEKDKILELYMNTINLGQNTLGVQAASLRYFNKPASAINISEAAVLAAIPQNPSRFNPIRYPENNAERRKKVLGNMLEQGFISQEEYDEAMNDDVYARIKVTNNSKSKEEVYTYFVDALTEQVIEDLQTEKGLTAGPPVLSGTPHQSPQALRTETLQPPLYSDLRDGSF